MPRGGGGQQSAGFCILGANVTVFDISEVQLEHDRQAASHYGLDLRTIQGDMRDLSVFEDNSFDVVWHGHSINFVPDAREVFRQVVRVLRPGGIYHLSCANPYFINVEPEDWKGDGYRLWDTYGDGEIEIANPYWTFTDPDGADQRVRGPREFRHTLETLINGMIELGFNILKIREVTDYDPDAELEPGTWPHFQSIAPPYLTFWATLTAVGIEYHRESSSPLRERIEVRVTIAWKPPERVPLSRQRERVGVRVNVPLSPRRKPAAHSAGTQDYPP